MTMHHQRLRAMLFGWGSVGLAYSLGAALHAPGRVIDETALDRALPFTPAAVWPYLSFFVLVPLAYLACAPRHLVWLQRSMQLCALVCGLCFVLWPTTLVYPSLQGDSLSLSLLRTLAASDSSHNCLPSLHGALSLLAMAALWAPGRLVRRCGLLAWGLALAASIVMARRHLALDLGAGIALGVAAGLVVRTWLAHRATQATRTLEGAQA